MLVPLGARSASWSKVMHSPPAARMRARAFSVNLRAHTTGHVAGKVLGQGKLFATSEFKV